MLERMSKHKGVGKKIILFGVVPLVVLIAAAAIIFYTFRQAPAANVAEEPTNQSQQAVQEAYNKALAAAQKDPTEAQALLDEQLDQETTPEGQAVVYGMKASVASSYESGNDYETALGYALQADTLNGTPDSAANVAFYYTQLGDTQKAIEFYQLALQRLGAYDSLDPMQQSEYDYYQQVIQDLQDGGQ